ncbi:MAG: protein kinase [Planctomycetota bacterium]
MSSENWHHAKEALAQAMELAGDERNSYLANLQQSSPELHAEVVSLLESQAEAEQQGFLDRAAETSNHFDDQETANPRDAEETADQYLTGTYDPDRTRDYVTTDDLQLPPKRSDAPSDLVGPDYELEKKIGQGGMGSVYKAYHRSLRRTVALKIITGGGLRDEIDIARFHIEAEAAARLDHPGIIPVYDVGEHNGNHYYAMAYVEGPSLSEFVGPKAKKLTPQRAAEVMEQVCRAVQFAHDRAVIHRDLKPANIMLENGEVPRLADFGLAKDMGQDDGLTMTGQVMGTPSYMAPEQATGKLDEISNRTDVYSLGATLYALLAGRPPFSGGTMLETIRQVVRADPEPLTQIVNAIPPDLQTICEKCLAKKPQDRYAAADEVADDLQRFLQRKPISARPLGFWARGWRLCQRHPIESSLLALALAAIIIGSIVSVNYGIQANRALAQANRANTKANRALSQATEHQRDLRDAVKEMFVFVSEDDLAQEPGMQPARMKLLNSAQRYYSELIEQVPDDAESQRELADAQFMLAKVQMALGQDEQATKTLDEALRTQQKLAQQSPDDAGLLAAMAKTHNQLAIVAQKQWQSLTQMQSMDKLGSVVRSEVEAALASWKQHSADAIRFRRSVVALTPDQAEANRLLASALMNEGNAMSIRGYTNRDLLEQDRARQQLLEAQQVRQNTLQDFPNETLVRRDLGRGYFNLASNEFTATDHESKEEAMRARWNQCVADLTSAITAYEQLPSDSLKLDTKLELARCYRLRADTHFYLMDVEHTGEDYKAAENVLRLLTLRNPSVYRYRIVLAEAQFNYSQFCFNFGQQELGLLLLGKSRATLLQSLRIDPSSTQAANQYLTFTQTIVAAFVENLRPDLAMAETVAQQALDEIRALFNESKEFEVLLPIVEELQDTVQSIQTQRGKDEESSTVT